MRFLSELCIKLFCKYIGRDKLGNRYYLSNRKDYLGNNKRYVIYKESIEPSLVEPVWHAWLHYNSDKVPGISEKNFFWQQDYTPNLTGTKLAFDPRDGVKIEQVKYTKWQPK